MIEEASYVNRLRQFQKVYSSTLDWKSAVKQFHEAVIRFTRQASVETNRCKRYFLETRALMILNLLHSFLEDSRAQDEADNEICEQLIMIYHGCSIHLVSGRYEKASQLMQALIRSKAIGREVGRAQ